MPAAFIQKLEGSGPLPSSDVAFLRDACAVSREVPARYDLIRDGDPPGPLFIMIEGWACRYKLLPEGTRQITAFLMPGDCCDLYASLLVEMDHSIMTLTPARVAAVPRHAFEAEILRRPALLRALWHMQLVDEGTLRAWIVSMGRRDSVRRVAHLMCELYVRARSIGLVTDQHFELPLTQTVLGDALGLTPVHVNRVLRRLRLENVMELRAGALMISDITKLAATAGFRCELSPPPRAPCGLKRRTWSRSEHRSHHNQSRAHDDDCGGASIPSIRTLVPIRRSCAGQIPSPGISRRVVRASRHSGIATGSPQ